jgi:hypothetical protein
MARNGRATVLNTSRLEAAEVEPVLAESFAYDWRTPPPEMSQDEWLVLYDAGDFTPRTAANRMKTALAKMGDAFELWRLPSP